MMSNSKTGEGGTASRFAVSATVFCLVVGSTALAAAAGGSAEKAPKASVEKKVKKLQRQLKKLKGQINEIAREQGPAGPQGQPGATGATGATGGTGAPGPATGAAGGDLTGSFPNPTIAPGAIGQDTDTAIACVGNGNCSAKIGNSAIGRTEIGANQVRTSEIADGAVVASNLGSIVIRSSVVPVPTNFTIEASVDCAAGEVLLSGGAEVKDPLPIGEGGAPSGRRLLVSRPDGNGWKATGADDGPRDSELVVFARCLQT